MCGRAGKLLACLGEVAELGLLEGAVDGFAIAGRLLA
jgi:hypothetical protein